jgi:hypothetical protein
VTSKRITRRLCEICVYLSECPPYVQRSAVDLARAGIEEGTAVAILRIQEARSGYNTEKNTPVGFRLLSNKIK